MRRRSSLVVAGALGLAGCVPDFLDDTTRITTQRVVAVRATPAEAAESEQVTLEALLVAPVVSAPAELAWSLCLDRKPLSELGPVSTRCLASPDPGADIAEPIDPAPPVTTSLPSDACELFGPERPEPKPGQPSGRPVDPDVTGGFYQPVLAWIGREPVLGGVRLSCPLVGASPEITREFNASYHPNTNPAPVALEAVRGDGTSGTLSDPGTSLAVAPEEHVTLKLNLPGCDPDAESCGGAESYVVYDALSESVESRRESLVVSWYATDGTFAEPRTEAPATDAEAVASNVFTLPARSGVVTVWAVARDDRGGAGWLSGSLIVPP